MKAIVVGLGGRGRFWLKTCQEEPLLDVVACVEPAAANRESAMKDLGVRKEKLYDDLNAALKAVRADFIVDITPPKVHEQVALTAFENGLHVLGEKPLSDDFGVAKRIVAAGKRAGLKHQITQNYRWSPLPRTTRRLMREKTYGEPGEVDISFYVPWADLPGSHYVTEPYMFLTDMGIHHFDMLRYVLDMEPLSAQALTWNLPWGWHKGDAAQLVIFRFPNGLIASHRAVGCTLGKRTTYNGEWRIETPKGSLTWEGTQLFHTQEHRTEQKVRTELPLDQAGTGGPKQLLKDFLKALQENRQPECNAEDNLKSMSMVFAAVKSAQEKREVRLSEL